MQESLPIGASLLSIILYSDATTTDTLGKSQLHPTSGNFFRRKVTQGYTARRKVMQNA